MFALDEERLFIRYTLDDADLACAWAELEGYEMRKSSKKDVTFVPTQLPGGVWERRICMTRARAKRIFDQRVKEDKHVAERQSAMVPNVPEDQSPASGIFRLSLSPTLVCEEERAVERSDFYGQSCPTSRKFSKAR